MFHTDIIRNNLCCSSLGACFMLSTLFVASLYVWNSPHDRNHPSTIKRRFCSVFVVMVISLVIVRLFLINDSSDSATLAESLGLRTTGIIPAMVLPLILTMILFLGPLSMQDFTDLKNCVTSPTILMMHFRDLIWLRNIIVSPICEEFTFRACMIPLLLQCFKPLTAVFICAFFFGLGHIHHMLERLRAGDPVNVVILMSCFEFLYTAIFGAYSAFLFVKTGHFISPVIVHSFCNVMGFPDFNRIFTYKNPKRAILIGLFVAGIVIWMILLKPMTSPALYGGNVFLGNE